jgi:hypothetical protein
MPLETLFWMVGIKRLRCCFFAYMLEVGRKIMADNDNANKIIGTHFIKWCGIHCREPKKIQLYVKRIENLCPFLCGEFKWYTIDSLDKQAIYIIIFCNYYQNSNLKPNK